MSSIEHETFTRDLGDAMRTGEPGPCMDPLTLKPRSWHPLARDAYRALRDVGTAGVAYCADCGKPLYVPSDPSNGIPIRGLRRYIKDMPMKAERL